MAATSSIYIYIYIWTCLQHAYISQLVNLASVRATKVRIPPGYNLSITSLSHRPTLRTKSIVLWRIWNLFHEKCTSTSGTGTHDFCTIACFPPRLSTSATMDRRPGKKLAWLDWNAIELLWWFWLVGWPKPIWHKLATIWLSYTL